MGEFDSKSDNDTFLGYSTSSKSYFAFSKNSMIDEVLVHVSFKETNLLDLRKYDNTIGTLPDALKKMNLINSNQERDDFQSPLEQEPTYTSHDLPMAWRFIKYHPKEQIIGDA